MKLFDLGNRISETKFAPVAIGDILVSIQASEAHYSEPCENHPSSDDYETFEVAIKDAKTNELIHPRFDPRFKDASWIGLFRGSSYDKVAAYVPRKEVFNLLKDLFLSYQEAQCSVLKVLDPMFLN